MFIARDRGLLISFLSRAKLLALLFYILLVSLFCAHQLRLLQSLILKPPIRQVVSAKNAWKSRAYIAWKEMYKGEFSSLTRKNTILSVSKA